MFMSPTGHPRRYEIAKRLHLDGARPIASLHLDEGESFELMATRSHAPRLAAARVTE
jgi:hypothetical protein